jgi:hypothetical protein
VNKIFVIGGPQLMVKNMVVCLLAVDVTIPPTQPVANVCQDCTSNNRRLIVEDGRIARRNNINNKISNNNNNIKDIVHRQHYRVQEYANSKIGLYFFFSSVRYSDIWYHY